MDKVTLSIILGVILLTATISGMVYFKSKNFNENFRTQKSIIDIFDLKSDSR